MANLKKIRTTSALSISLIFFVSAAWSQQASKDQICEQVIPDMLEMVISAQKISPAFNAAYDSSFDSEAKAAFAPVVVLGTEINKIFDDYRKAFLKACYG